MTIREFKGKGRVPNGFTFEYNKSIYDKDAEEIYIGNGIDIDANIVFDPESNKFILSYDTSTDVDAIAVLNWQEAMKIIKELIKEIK